MLKVHSYITLISTSTPNKVPEPDEMKLELNIELQYSLESNETHKEQLAHKAFYFDHLHSIVHCFFFFLFFVHVGLRCRQPLKSLKLITFLEK